MSLTEQEEQRLRALVGRVEELEKKLTSYQPDRALAHSQQHSILNSSDHSDKNDVVEIPMSPTILTGGALSDGTNAGTLKVAKLTALLRTTDSTLVR